MAERDLERNAVHHSLIRTPLFLGVDYRMLLVEGALAGGVLFVAGLELASLLPVGVGVAAVHLPARRLLARDPLMMGAVAEALRFRAYYAPHGSACTGAPPPRPSIVTSDR